jgi:hypothetical protein
MSSKYHELRKEEARWWWHVAASLCHLHLTTNTVKTQQTTAARRTLILIFDFVQGRKTF